MANNYDDLIASAATSQGVDPHLLKGVLASESSMNPNATGPVLPDGTTAKGLAQFIPSTAKQYGVTDPYEPQQAIPAAARLLKDKLAAANGDEATAVNMYKGVSNPANRSYPGTQVALNNAANYRTQDAVANDPVLRALQGTPQQGSAQQPAQPQQAQAPQAPPDFSNDPVLKALQAPAQPPASSPASPASAPSAPTAPPAPEGLLAKAGGLLEPTLRIATSAATTPFAGLAGIATQAANALGLTDKTGADAVNAVQDFGTYKPLTQAGQGRVDALGRTVGAVTKAATTPVNTETLGDVNPISRYPAQGEALADAGHPILAAIHAAGPQAVAALAAPEARGAFSSLADVGAGAAKSVAGTGAKVVSKVGDAMDAAASKAGPSPVMSAEQAQAARAALAKSGVGNPLDAPSDVSGPGSRSTNGGAYAENGGASGTKPATFQVISAEAPGSEGSSFSPEEQKARADTLRRVGIADTRGSAITGNVKEAGKDFQTAKLDEPAGVAMDSLIQNERAGLVNHANSIIDGTGGSSGLDEETLHARGTTELAPFDAYKQHFDQQIKAAYDAADQASNGAPSIHLNGLSDLLDTDSAFAGQRSGLRDGVRAYMREQGITDPEGNMQPVTAKQAEGVRQYINTQWNPDNSRLTGMLKDHIDDDVLSSAGGDIYEQARALRAQRGRILDDPTGVAKIMESDPQNPMNRSVSVDKIPDFISKLAPDQLNHLVDTLHSMPEEIQPQAQAAISEIRAHFANKVREAGLPEGASPDTSWNPKRVTKYLNDNSKKLGMVFEPDELSKFQDLNDAGHILQMRKAYPGAEAQKANFARQGLASVTRGAVAAGGAGLGTLATPFVGHAAIAAGAGMGDMLGGLMTRSISERGALKATQARMVNLSDLGK